MGTTEFVDRIKSRYVTGRPHREVSQQRGMAGRIDIGYLRQASELLGRDLKRFRETGRLYGEEREDWDILAYLLWEKGAFTHEEIGAVFGVSNSAISHIVRRVKRQLWENKSCQRKRDLVNSQFKI